MAIGWRGEIINIRLISFLYIKTHGFNRITIFFFFFKALHETICVCTCKKERMNSFNLMYVYVLNT